MSRRRYAIPHRPGPIRRRPGSRVLIAQVPRVLQVLTGAVFVRSATFVTGVITRGAVTLSGAVFTKAPTFGAGTVSLSGGAQNLTGAVFTKAPTFGAGTITRGPVTLSGSTFTRAPSFGAGVVTRGPRTLSGATFTKAPTFPSGSVSFAGADPPNFQVNIAGTTAQLTWTASPTSGVVDYQVFRRSPGTGGTFDPNVASPIATGITGTSYNDVNLPAGVYDWQVFGRIVVGPGTQNLTGTTFTRGPTFLNGQVSLAGLGQLTGAVFQRAPSFPTGGKISHTVRGAVFTKAPTFGAGKISHGLVGATFTRSVTFPYGLLGNFRLLTGVVTSRATPQPSRRGPRSRTWRNR